MKKLLLITFMLGMVSIAAAQTSNTGASGTAECKLKLAQAPAIRGIRLGMTVDQLLAVFPGSEKDEALRYQLSRSRFGLASAGINPSTYSSKESFLGVKGVSVSFFDGELSFFSIVYDGPDWKTSDQFTMKVVEALKLPGIEFWRGSGDAKVLKCDGFEVVTQRGSGTSVISVRNREKDVNQTISEREDAVKDKARKAFKP